MQLKLVVINLILKLADLITTFWAVGKAGKVIEANPVMKYALINLGNWAYPANFFVFLLALMLLCRRKSTWSLIIVAIIMLGAVVNNTFACMRLAGGW
jgi:hypothetical protein